MQLNTTTESLANGSAATKAAQDESFQPLTMADGEYSLAFVQQLREALIATTHVGSHTLHHVLPCELLMSVIKHAYELLRTEATLLEIQTQSPDVQMFVVGDTHGQFHDVCHMLDLFGYPNEQRIYIFNGDYVDRGSWGVELMALLLCLKLALPRYVYLLRGNHESSTCTQYYGFKGEVEAKYFGAVQKQLQAQQQQQQQQAGAPAAADAGTAPAAPAAGPTRRSASQGAGRGSGSDPLSKAAADSKGLYQAFKKLFSVLPLAALLQGRTLVLHGGLFRHHADAPARRPGGKRRRKAGAPSLVQLETGSLEDLRAANKGGLDPDGTGSSVVAADVLWSDPVAAPGMQTNDARGVGLTFGPDVTQAFLEQNGLSLIIRSHEGPDARDRRTDLPQVLTGYAIDHDTPAGKLLTVFSAPDYPQFQATEERYNNQGAVVLLTWPDYCTPAFKSFSAVLPRPVSEAYYDYLSYMDTDEEPGGEEGCAASQASHEAATHPAPSSGTSGLSTASRQGEEATSTEAGPRLHGAARGAEHGDPGAGQAEQPGTDGREQPAAGAAAAPLAVAGDGPAEALKVQAPVSDDVLADSAEISGRTLAGGGALHGPAAHAGAGVPSPSASVGAKRSAGTEAGQEEADGPSTQRPELRAEHGAAAMRSAAPGSSENTGAAGAQPITLIPSSAQQQQPAQSEQPAHLNGTLREEVGADDACTPPDPAVLVDSNAQMSVALAPMVSPAGKGVAGLVDSRPLQS